MRLYLTCLLLCSFPCFSAAQKFLQLERVNSPKTRKYAPGDEITFQMVGGQWYTRVIEDISYEQSLLLFANGAVSVDSITAMRSYKTRKLSRSLGNQFYNFAIAWTGFALISAAVDDSDTYSRGDLTLAATSVATGFLIQKIFKKRSFYLDKNKKGEPRKWRLRVLDLTVQKQR